MRELETGTENQLGISLDHTCVLSAKTYFRVMDRGTEWNEYTLLRLMLNLSLTLTDLLGAGQLIGPKWPAPAESQLCKPPHSL